MWGGSWREEKQLPARVLDENRDDGNDDDDESFLSLWLSFKFSANTKTFILLE